MKIARDPDLALPQLAAGRAFIESLGMSARDVQYGGIALERRWGREIVEITLIMRDRHGRAKTTRDDRVATRTRRFPVHRLTPHQTRALDRIKEIL